MNYLQKSEEYLITNEELREIQQKQLELICEVDRICRKNNITYCMVGGTMLGAIRHEGYIPWDDDADIGFLRTEYEKFRNACKNELNDDMFYFQDFRDTEGYRWGYGKLRRKGTQFVRFNQEFMPYEQGIAIDLMPFDNVPDGIISKKIHQLVCYFFRKTFWSAVGRNEEKNIWKRQIYNCLFHIPQKEIIARYKNFIKRSNSKDTKQVRILTFPTPHGVYGYNREWYRELTLYKFEDMMLPGAKDFDGYLGTKYGDYMDLPPENKRKVHPISKLVLLKQEINK